MNDWLYGHHLFFFLGLRFFWLKSAFSINFSSFSYPFISVVFSL